MSKRIEGKIKFATIDISKAYPRLKFHITQCNGLVEVVWVNGPTIEKFNEFWVSKVVPTYKSGLELVKFQREYSVDKLEAEHKLLPNLFRDRTHVEDVKRPYLGVVGLLSCSNSDHKLLLEEAQQRVLDSLRDKSFIA